MQSEILTFKKDGKNNKLFGDFNNLSPKYISGIAHAFREEQSWILTLYSETGLVNGNDIVCSADIRIAMNEKNIKHLITELSSLVNLEDKKVEHSEIKNAEVVPKKETLGPILL